MSSIMGITTDAPSGGVEYRTISLDEPEKFEVKLKPVFTGICGTDRGIVSGSLPFSYNPNGYDYLVLGHESVCRVEDTIDNDYGIKTGDYVVPVVRRPGGCVNCSIGRPDNCSDGDKHEAGITGLHGFMRESFYDEFKNLVKVNDSSMVDVAVLTEPLKNVMKAFEVFDSVSKRSIFQNDLATYEGKKAVIIGTGAQAFLYGLMAREYGFQTGLINRHPVGENILKIIDSMGANFYDYSKDMDEVVKGGIDLLIDTSGNPSTLFSFVRKLNYNGIAILFGTNGKAKPTDVSGVDVDYIVEKNISLVGSVDGARPHYSSAVEYLRKWRSTHGAKIRDIITNTYDPNDTEIFTKKLSDEIKSVIKWG